MRDALVSARAPATYGIPIWCRSPKDEGGRDPTRTSTTSSASGLERYAGRRFRGSAGGPSPSANHPSREPLPCRPASGITSPPRTTGPESLRGRDARRTLVVNWPTSSTSTIGHGGERPELGSGGGFLRRCRRRGPHLGRGAHAGRDPVGDEPDDHDAAAPLARWGFGEAPGTSVWFGVGTTFHGAILGAEPADWTRTTCGPPTARQAWRTRRRRTARGWAEPVPRHRTRRMDVATSHARHDRGARSAGPLCRDAGGGFFGAGRHESGGAEAGLRGDRALHDSVRAPGLERLRRLVVIR